MTFLEFPFPRHGKVGIASKDFVERRQAAILAGTMEAGDDEPVVWLSSEDEYYRILKNPNHPRHNQVRRAATGHVWKKARPLRPRPWRKPYPHVNGDQADCTHRLILLMEGLVAEPGARSPMVRQIIQDTTILDMRRFYSGTRPAGEDGPWQVFSVHPAGLAALDPWFLEFGLTFSTIPKPGEPDWLDVSGVMVSTPNWTWRRRMMFETCVGEVFGIYPLHWEMICDPRHYQVEFGMGRIEPWMVLKRLVDLTRETHAPKFTGAALAV